MNVAFGIVLCLAALITAAQEWRHNEGVAVGIAISGVALLALFVLNA